MVKRYKQLRNSAYWRFEALYRRGLKYTYCTVEIALYGGSIKKSSNCTWAKRMLLR